MNIKTIYKEMEIRSTFNVSIYFEHLQKHINSSNFDLKGEVLDKDNKYPRALTYACLSPKKPQMFMNLISLDNKFPVFTSHMALIKCSAELLNPNNSIDELSLFINNIVLDIKKAKLNTPGTTLSLAFGFVLGTAIKRGLSAKQFFNTFDSKFIVDNTNLFQGLCEGLTTKNTLLILNRDYLNNFDERYDDWEAKSRLISLSMFKAIPVEPFNAYINVNEDNLKILEFFSGKNTSYDSFFNEYKAKFNNLNIQQKNTEIKKDFIDDDELTKLKKIVNKQQQDIKTITNELNLYQEIFKQFEQIFPDLNKIVQHTDNKNLLTKINQLIESKKENIEILTEYYSVNEKQKEIKDSLKKHF